MRLRAPARSILAALALSALPSTLLPRDAGAQSDRRALSGSTVAIYDLVGHVTIEAGTGNDVVVEITRRGADASKLSVDVATVDGRNTLRIIYPDDDIIYPDMNRRGNWEFSIDRDGRWGGYRSDRWTSSRRYRVKSSGRGTEAWADMKILIPPGKRVDVNVGVGDAVSTNVASDLSIDVASASVTVNGHKGSLHLDTGSGRVDVRDVTGADEFTSDAGSGTVTVRNATARRMKLDSGSGGLDADNLIADELNVDVGSGHVRVDRTTAERVRLETGSGGVSLELRNSPKTLDVESGSGSVTLTLPASLDAEVDIETGSGGIDTDFAVQLNRMERRRLRGTIGKGTGRIRIETGSGSVRLRKA